MNKMSKSIRFCKLQNFKIIKYKINFLNHRVQKILLVKQLKKNFSKKILIHRWIDH